MKSIIGSGLDSKQSELYFRSRVTFLSILILWFGSGLVLVWITAFDVFDKMPLITAYRFWFGFQTIRALFRFWFWFGLLPLTCSIKCHSEFLFSIDDKIEGVTSDEDQNCQKDMRAIKQQQATATTQKQHSSTPPNRRHMHKNAAAASPEQKKDQNTLPTTKHQKDTKPTKTRLRKQRDHPTSRRTARQ
ncbi:hypothetical protein LXL04_016706 [Taraxacum kok-saghyz]